MLDAALKLVEPLLLSLLVGLLGWIAAQLKKLPRFFLDFTERLVLEAAKTPDKGDDVRAAALQLVAKVLHDAVEGTFASRGSAAAVAPVPRPAAAAITQVTAPYPSAAQASERFQAAAKLPTSRTDGRGPKP